MNQAHHQNAAASNAAVLEVVLRETGFTAVKKQQNSDVLRWKTQKTK